MATFTWTGAGDTDWIQPTNWLAGGAATAIAPNDPTADAVATINGPDDFEPPIISGGAAITLNSLTAAGTTHVIVGGGQLGGTGTGTLNALGSISVTSTNAGGGLVGALGSTITTPLLTVGAGVVVGGGGTYNVLSLVNSGIIQGDGANFGLGALTVTGGTITGTGSIEVDGPSTFELGSATAETITVVAAPTETATVIFDDPGSFTGSLNLFNADTHLNLFFQGQTPTGATFDGESLIVTGATGTIDVIPMIAVGPVVLGTSGSGEVSINSLQPPALTLERDFNGDHSDILWQNDNGSAAIWLMNAAGTAQITGAVLDNPGPDWHTIGSEDMHFINATSTTGTLAAISQADEFVLTSPVFGSETISGFDPRQDILELSKAHFTTFADVQAHSAASAGGALIALDSSSSLLLSGVTLGQLHATNFVFA